jgi:hypothetical protein
MGNKVDENRLNSVGPNSDRGLPNAPLAALLADATRHRPRDDAPLAGTVHCDEAHDLRVLLREKGQAEEGRVLGEWAAARCEGSKAPGATNLGGPGALRDPRLHVVRPALRYLACSAHGATLLREEISDEFAVVVPAAGNARSSEEREVLKHRAQSVWHQQTPRNFKGRRLTSASVHRFPLLSIERDCSVRAGFAKPPITEEAAKKGRVTQSH